MALRSPVPSICTAPWAATGVKEQIARLDEDGIFPYTLPAVAAALPAIEEFEAGAGADVESDTYRARRTRIDVLAADGGGCILAAGEVYLT